MLQGDNENNFLEEFQSPPLLVYICKRELYPPTADFPFTENLAKALSSGLYGLLVKASTGSTGSLPSASLI